MKRALITGSGGFIGSHLAKFLKNKGYYVKGVDLKNPEYSESACDEHIIGDLRSQELVKQVFDDEPFDEIYQLAADMGGAGYIFTGDNDADVMHNSALINLNILEKAVETKSKKIFYSSSACIYPEFNQLDPDNPNCEESSAYPAQPDSEYGWEKLFSERLYFAFMRNYGIEVKVARFHNIFGPEGTYQGGKEKAPAAICRKVAMANDGDQIEVWGDGKQTRSFLYIDECLEGVYRLMQSNFHGPINIGSEEMITINQLVEFCLDISGKNLEIKHIDGPTGVRGRKSDNSLILKELGWSPSYPVKTGLKHTYKWITKMVKESAS